MAVEERVIEEQVSGMMEQLRRIGTVLRQGALGCESVPYVGGRLRGGYWPARERFKKAGDAVDKLGA
jgi:hypothetical protein